MATITRFEDLAIWKEARIIYNKVSHLASKLRREYKEFRLAEQMKSAAGSIMDNIAEGFERVKEVIAGVIEEDVRRDIGDDEQQIHDLSTEYREITFKHLLLPVYAGAYHYNNKLYQIVVNGRTGEIQGDRPYSALKIALLVISILAVIGILVIVFGER